MKDLLENSLLGLQVCSHALLPVCAHGVLSVYILVSILTLILWSPIILVTLFNFYLCKDQINSLCLQIRSQSEVLGIKISVCELVRQLKL